MEPSRLLCESYLCRLCGQENKNSSSLYPATENDEDLSELVNKYLPLKVKNDGKFPTCICPGCNIQLEATKQFLDLIVEGQLKLRELFRLQQETLKRQEKQRRQLEDALKVVNPSSSVETYTIENDEEGEKFVIQIFSDGPLFSPNHEASLRTEGLSRPRKRRGRPTKQQELESQEQKVSGDEEPEVDGDGRRKRKRKLPSRLREAVKGKELDRMFKEEGVIDDNSESEKDPKDDKPPNEEVVGRLTNENGEDLGDLIIINKNTNRLRIKPKNDVNDVVTTKKKKIECEICNKEFQHFGKYELHKATHKNVMYQCANDGCYLEFNTKEELNNHFKESDHSEVIYVENIKNDTEAEKETVESSTPESTTNAKTKEKFACEDCNKTFSCKQNFEVHIRAVHENSRPFQCDKCEKTFAYHNSLKQHMIQHDRTEKMFNCKTCNKAFNHPSSLVYHREAEHNGRRFVCNKCNKSFKHKQLLQRHQLVHTTDRPHTCKVCNGTFKTRANLINHMAIHSGIKKFFCQQCGLSFAHKTSLTLHTRWHSGQKPYECDICMKTFSQKGNLAEHKRIHTGEKPFCCDHCGRKFTTSSQFKLHVKRHTGEKPWRCEYCLKTFLQRDTWKCHTRRHRNEKPFQCKQCYRGFTEQWSLKKHERLHLGIKPYVCNVCEKGFSDCSNLTKHKRIHKNPVPPKPAELDYVEPANENHVLYLAYDGNSNDSQPSTLVHLMDPIDMNTSGDGLDDSTLLSSTVLNEPFNEKLLQHIIDQDSTSLSITTSDGQEIKIVSKEEDGQQTILGMLQDGALVPLNITFQDGKPLITFNDPNVSMESVEDSQNEETSLDAKNDATDEANLLNSSIQLLNSGQNICLVTTLNGDETVTPQYLTIN